MIDPKAEPVDHRPPYKRIDLAARRRVVCPECGVENPENWINHKTRCSAILAEPKF